MENDITGDINETFEDVELIRSRFKGEHITSRRNLEALGVSAPH